jgi:O-methyltransferase
MLASLKTSWFYRLARACYVGAITQHALLKRRRYERVIDEEYKRAVDLAVRYLKGGAVEGDIAEFGTRGHTATIECQHLAAYGMKRNLHLFDSFRGPPQFSAEDVTAPEIIAGSWNDQGVPAKLAADALKRKLERIYRLGKIHIYEGYFSDTLATIPPETRFGMVVLDCVIFSSTDQALDYIFANGLVSEGAVFMVSSWNVSRGSPQQSTRKAWNKAVKKFQIEYSDEGRYNWGGARFLVHSYVPQITA